MSEASDRCWRDIKKAREAQNKVLAQSPKVSALVLLSR
jgi:hypothetical protein